jgi:hypothetical protein
MYKLIIIFSIFALISFDLYVFAAAGPTVSTPVAGTVLNGPDILFTWPFVSGTTAYAAWIGNTYGGADIANITTGTNSYFRVTGLPTDGRIIYLQLRSQASGVWSYNNFQYKAGPLTYVNYSASFNKMASSFNSFTTMATNTKNMNKSFQRFSTMTDALQESNVDSLKIISFLVGALASVCFALAISAL